MGIVYTIIIGAIAGWLAGNFTKGSGFGVGKNIILGVIGGFVGSITLSLLGLAATGFVGEIVASTVGAVLFIGLLRYIAK